VTAEVDYAPAAIAKNPPFVRTGADGAEKLHLAVAQRRCALHIVVTGELEKRRFNAGC